MGLTPPSDTKEEPAGDIDVDSVVPPEEAEEVRVALEEMWLDTKSAPCVLLVGARGSGKSFMANKMLRAALSCNAIDVLFACVPVYNYEASGSYRWFSLPEFKDRIFVSEAYSPSLTQKLLDRPITDDSKRIAYWIDDLAASDGEVFWADKNYQKLLVISRHKKTCLVLCNHSVASGHQIPAFVRQQISHIFLLRVSNRKLLESAFIEFMSLHPAFQGNFQFFLRVFTELSAKGPGSGICVDLAGKAPGKVALTIRDWWAEHAPDVGVPKEGDLKKGKPKTEKKAGDDSGSSSNSDSDRDGGDRRPKRPRGGGPGERAGVAAIRGVLK